MISLSVQYFTQNTELLFRQRLCYPFDSGILFSDQLSVISYQLSVISYQCSVFHPKYRTTFEKFDVFETSDF